MNDELKTESEWETLDGVKLPPLPQPVGRLPRIVPESEHGHGPDTMLVQSSPVYTADQLRAYARTAIEQDRAHRGSPFQFQRDATGNGNHAIQPDPDKAPRLRTSEAWQQAFTAKAKGVVAGDGEPCPNDHDPDCRWPDCNCRRTWPLGGRALGKLG